MVNRALHKIYYCFLAWRAKQEVRKNISKLQGQGVGGLQNCFIDAMCSFEGKNAVGHGSTLKSTDCGFATYVGADCYFERTIIGRYCSIANNVRVTAGEHPTSEWVSTHPAFYSVAFGNQFGFTNEQKFCEYKFADMEKKCLSESAMTCG